MAWRGGVAFAWGASRERKRRQRLGVRRVEVAQGSWRPSKPATRPKTPAAMAKTATRAVPLFWQTKEEEGETKGGFGIF